MKSPTLKSLRMLATMMETPEKAAPMAPATGWLGSSPGRQWRLLLTWLAWLWARYFSFS